MAYADYATSYLQWLTNLLAYYNGEAYKNFEVKEIKPDFEINSFKKSVDVNQQQVFHNAADDQVATLRCLKEINKEPSSYLDDFATEVNAEMGLIQTTATNVANLHETQTTESNVNLYNFFNVFAPDMLADNATYDPMRIIDA